MLVIVGLVVQMQNNFVNGPPLGLVHRHREAQLKGKWVLNLHLRVRLDGGLIEEIEFVWLCVSFGCHQRNGDLFLVTGECLKSIKLTLTSFSDSLTVQTLTYFNIDTGCDVNDNLIPILEIAAHNSFSDNVILPLC